MVVDGVYLDTHTHPVLPEVLELAALLAELAPGAPVLLERDGDARYHGLQPCDEKFDRLLVDFKLVTGAHPSYLDSWISMHPGSAVAALEAPFRDRLIQRFVGYLGRIPEPAD